jgi:cytochrome c-type biogenesis protein CcmF
MGLGVWLVAGALVELAERARLLRAPFRGGLRRLGRLPRATWGMCLAHGGIGLVVIGIVGVSAWESERLLVMYPGDATEIAGYTVTFKGAAPAQGPNYAAIVGEFQIARGGRQIAVMRPESRTYANPPMTTTEAAIRPRLNGDLYVVVGDPTGDGGWSARIYWKPLVNWLWIGTLVMVLGGLFSLSDRRFRIGAPVRRPLPPGGATAPGD